MAVSIKVASRYSKALIQIASDKGVLDVVKADMDTVIELFKNSKDFVLFVESPVVGPTQKKEIFDKIFKGKVNAITSTFFDLMVDKGRENGLLVIAKDFMRRYNVLNGIQTVQFFTSDEVSDGFKNELSNTLANSLGKKIELNSIIKKDLIGGYILRVGDKQIDHSVKGSLQKLRNQFVK